jgi:hypothetical protein
MNCITRDRTKKIFKANVKVSFNNSFRTLIKVIKHLKVRLGTMMKVGQQKSQILQNKMIPTLMLVQLCKDIHRVF